MADEEKARFIKEIEWVFLIVCLLIILPLLFLGGEMRLPVDWQKTPTWFGLLVGSMLPIGYFMATISSTIDERLSHRESHSDLMEAYSIVTAICVVLGLIIGFVLAAGAVLANTVAPVMAYLSPSNFFLKAYVWAFSLGMTLVWVTRIARRSFPGFYRDWR